MRKMISQDPYNLSSGQSTWNASAAPLHNCQLRQSGGGADVVVVALRDVVPVARLRTLNHLR